MSYKRRIFSVKYKKENGKGNSMSTQERIAMYEIRGIQDFIFLTVEVKDAIGAATIVENTITDALGYAVKRLISKGELLSERVELEWCSWSIWSIWKVLAQNWHQ